MTDMEKVLAYLDKAQIFYVITVDGDKPKCRPFSFKMVYDGKIFFGVGTFKNCYRQMQSNPNIEICASDGKGFLRYYSKAVFVDDEQLTKQVFDEAEYLSKMYNEQTGHKLGMFYLADATAEFCGLMGVQETLKFSV